MKRKTLTITTPIKQGVAIDSQIERTCLNCRFYDHELGLCRKRSPYRDIETGLAIWPGVELDDWCGDFKRLPSEPTEAFMS
jgi:hypothetical protein